jgi:hypothetical protein
MAKKPTAQAKGRSKADTATRSNSAITRRKKADEAMSAQAKGRSRKAGSDQSSAANKMISELSFSAYKGGTGGRGDGMGEKGNRSIPRPAGTKKPKNKK